MTKHVTRTGEWITIADAATELGTCTKTIRRMISRGTLPAHRISGSRQIRLRRQDVEALLTPIPAVGVA